MQNEFLWHFLSYLSFKFDVDNQLDVATFLALIPRTYTKLKPIKCNAKHNNKQKINLQKMNI